MVELTPLSSPWHVEAEIASQPGSWRQAADRAEELRALLPDGRIALTGCGTSFYVAQAVAYLWESGGHGQADAFASSEMPLRSDYSRVVVISRSGTTTEVVDLLARLGDVPTAAAAGAVLDLSYADEESVVQTRFATSVIAVFRALVGHDLEHLATTAQQVLDAPVRQFADVHRFVFLGTGFSVGLAHEAALKMREAAQTVTESYPAMEYRHGPIALAEPGVVVWMLGDAPPGLIAEVLHTGAVVVNDELDPLVDLIRVQSAAVLIAREKGLDADRPRNLTRAVLLDSPGEDPA
jgi:fructoselysine-6-P-deglycase FrlB-like protein